MGFSAAASRAEAPQGNEPDVTQTDVDFPGEAITQVIGVVEVMLEVAVAARWLALFKNQERRLCCA